MCTREELDLEIAVYETWLARELAFGDRYRAMSTRRWIDEARADIVALAAEAPPPDTFVVDDHCPDCGEPEPECICHPEIGGYA